MSDQLVDRSKVITGWCRSQDYILVDVYDVNGILIGTVNENNIIPVPPVETKDE